MSTSSTPRALWNLSWLALIMIVLSGCSTAPPILRMELRTDYAPGVEFSTVEVVLSERVGDRDTEVSRFELSVDGDMHFLPAGRIGMVELDETGTYLVHVRLYMDDERAEGGLQQLASRRVITSVRGSTGVTAAIFRNCREVICPGAGDSADATECFDGYCVPPECGAPGGEPCPPMSPACVMDSDCSGGTECSPGQCLDEICWYPPDDSLCPAGEVCTHEAGGCVPDDCRTIWDGDCDDLACGGGLNEEGTSGAHSCAVIGGNLYCWGSNRQGQLGVPGVSVNSALPVRVRVDNGDAEGEVEWRRVTAGEGHTCAIESDGDLYCWGRNDEAQLGLGHTIQKDTPHRVAGGPWHDVDSDYFTTCGITTAGGLFCWGRNSENQAVENSMWIRTEEPNALRPDLRFISVATGQGHSCAVEESGRVFCLGRNSRGQIGNGSETDRAFVLSEVPLEPRAIEVSAGQFGTCVLTEDGEVYCWGLPSNGRLGLRDLVPPPSPIEDVLDRHFRLPQRVDDITGVRQVNVSAFHACAVVSGVGVCTGDNESGQLGPGSFSPLSDRYIPVSGDVNFRAIELGRFHSCGRTASGEAYCWGRNFSGNLGVGSIHIGGGLSAPTRVLFPAP